MVTKKIDITFMLPNLLAGGAERVVSFVAQQLNREAFNTTLVIVGHEKNAAYDIKGISVVYLEEDRVLKGIPKLFKYIKTHKPDIVFSAVGHLNTVTAYLSYFFPKTKFVAREVNVLSVLATFDKRQFNPFSYLEKKRFNRFDKIVCQSQDMLNDLNKHNTIKQDKLVVINNPITKGFELKTNSKKNEPLRFITVARLVKQKGHERIIQALGELEFPFKYTIVGDGSQKETLFQLIDNLKLSDAIEHIPYTKEVAKYLANSDVYLQGSYVEGFPNALIESCVVGTPVIAFNAPGGLNEIIETGVNGYICEDQDEFITRINHMHAHTLPKPEAVNQSVTKKYSEAIILKKYETVFKTLVQEHES